MKRNAQNILVILLNVKKRFFVGTNQSHSHSVAKNRRIVSA